MPTCRDGDFGLVSVFLSSWPADALAQHACQVAPLVADWSCRNGRSAQFIERPCAALFACYRAGSAHGAGGGHRLISPGAAGSPSHWRCGPGGIRLKHPRLTHPDLPEQMEFSLNDAAALAQAETGPDVPLYFSHVTRQNPTLLFWPQRARVPLIQQMVQIPTLFSHNACTAV